MIRTRLKRSLLKAGEAKKSILCIFTGKGSYGSAYLAVDKRTGQSMVLKEISLMGLSKKETEIALQEAKVNVFCT